MTPRIVFTGLQEPFIHKVDLQTSARAFDTWNQGTLSVKSTIDALMAIIDQMIDRPTDYDITCKFFEGIKPLLMQSLVKNQLTPENSSLAMLKDFAIEMQESHQYYDAYCMTSNANAGAHTSSSNRNRPLQSLSHRPS